MGKTGGSSWFTAVKKVFRSTEKRRNRRQDNDLVEEEADEQHQRPKRRKRRWLSKKASSDSSAKDIGINIRNAGNINSTAADVIVAEEIVSPTAKEETVFFCRTSVYLKRHVAAILIQTAFRGFLARTAFRALQGVVKLQALVRGHNVRRRASYILLRIQALVQIQARALDHQRKLTINPGDETSLSRAFSKQIWRTSAREAYSESELEDKRPSRINRFGYQETGRRKSTDEAVVEAVKIVEIDTYNNTYSHHQQLNDQTPSGKSRVTRQAHSIPNYMSATASAVAKHRRPQSVPKQRSNYTGLDNNEPRLQFIRKRLSFHKDNTHLHGYNGGDGYLWY